MKISYVIWCTVPILAQWHHMASLNMVNIDSGNGLLPDGTKQLPKPMSNYHKHGHVPSI